MDYAREADFYQLPPEAIPLPLLLHARVLQAHQAAVESMLAHLLVRAHPARRAPRAGRPAPRPVRDALRGELGRVRAPGARDGGPRRRGVPGVRQG